MTLQVPFHYSCFLKRSNKADMQIKVLPGLTVPIGFHLKEPTFQRTLINHSANIYRHLRIKILHKKTQNDIS